MRWKMKMAVIPAVLGLVAGLLAAAAQANVVYNWHPRFNGQYLSTTRGQLILTDAAYRKGSVQADYRYEDGAPDAHITENQDGMFIDNSPAVSLDMGFDSPDGYFSGSSYPIEPDFIIDQSFDAELTLNSDGTLTGSLYSLNDDSTVFSSDGYSTYWEVTGVGSDFLGGWIGDRCNTEQGCNAGTGYWAIDPSTIPSDVPAPPVWPLFALSALGIFGLIGQRRKA
jgi:hypothetical protein